ncbi:MAG TPA: CHASE2 domain-containing protein [Caulobacteraceae bacterium]
MISLGRILKAVLVSLVLAGSAYAVAKLNLFGLESASDRLADHVYQRITAADYGRDRKGQSRIRLVYLDDTSLEIMKGFGWKRFPPTYDQQWTMLDDIMSAGGAPPSAIFVDFVYRGDGGVAEGFDTFLKGVTAATHADAWADKPGCIADPLMKLACIEAAGGTPIILAKPSPSDLAMFTDVQRALDHVTVLAPAVVGQEAYPTITRYDFDAAKRQRLGVHAFDVSPAMAMYAAYCLRRSDGCGVEGFRRLRARAAAALAGQPLAQVSADAPERLSIVFKDPVDVVWGSRPDPQYLALTRAVTGHPVACRGVQGGWLQRLGEQMTGARGAGTGVKQECPYTQALGYDRIVSGEGLQQADLAQLLAGKLVMVGGQFHASNDWVESPVHGQVPGVQYHAMALDNLVEDGPEYRRNANMFLDSDLLKALLIAALAFCDVMAVMTRNSLLDHAQSKRAEQKLRAHIWGPLYAGLLLTSVGVIALATWVGVALLHRSPINWIGLGFCAIGFLFYATRQTLPADIFGSIEHIPFVRRIRQAGQRCRLALKFEEDRLLSPRAVRSYSSESSELTPSASSNDPPSEDTAHVET